MQTITEQEMSNYRQKLSAYPEAKDVLDTIKEVDGNIYEAVQLYTVRYGDIVTMGDSFAETVEFARVKLCEHKARWNDINDVLTVLKEFVPPPFSTAIFIAIVLSKMGLRNICVKDKSD